MEDLLQDIRDARQQNLATNLSLNNFAQLLPLDSHDWTPNSCDSNTSGLLVFCVMLFLLYKVPLFSPGEHDLDNLRFLIVHWLKARTLPQFVSSDV